MGHSYFSYFFTELCWVKTHPQENESYSLLGLTWAGRILLIPVLFSLHSLLLLLAVVQAEKINTAWPTGRLLLLV